MFIAIIVLLLINTSGQAVSKAKRKSKEIENHIDRLPPTTIRMIEEMKTLNIPVDSIADRIYTQVGKSMTTAKRVVEAIGEPKSNTDKKVTNGLNFDKDHKAKMAKQKTEKQKSRRKAVADTKIAHQGKSANEAKRKLHANMKTNKRKSHREL